MSTIWTYSYPGELYHHGIKGQKWGLRRFQNPDGSRTALGKRRRKEQEDLSKYSDDELIRKTNRNRTETNYLNSVRDRANAGKNTKQQNNSNSWASKLVTSIITTAATTLVADAIKNKDNSVLAKVVKKVGSVPLSAIKKD